MSQQVINPSVKSLRVFNKMIEGSTLSGLLAAQDYVKEQLRQYDNLLESLKAQEDEIIRKMHRNLTPLELEDQKAQKLMKENPVQEYDLIRQNPDKDELVVYAKNKLWRLTKGVEDLLRERRKIIDNIKRVTAEINNLNKKQEEVNKELAEKNSPTGEDLERDRIWNRSVSEVLMLYHITEIYKGKSRNDKGEEAYTEDRKIVRELEILRSKFVAYAERNPWVVNGKITLDFSNPGADTNEGQLRCLLESLRRIGYNKKYEEKTLRYINEMDKNINNPYISKRLQRTEDQQLTPSLGDSLQGATKDFNKFIRFTIKGANWWTKLELKYNKAKEKSFKRQIRKLYGNRPFCDDDPPTDEEKALESQEAQEAQNISDAEKEYTERQDRTEECPLTITSDMVLAFMSDDPVIKEFLKNPNRLSAMVMVDGKGYGVGIAYTGGLESAKKEANGRAISALPANGDTVVIARSSTPVEKPPLVGVLSISEKSGD